MAARTAGFAEGSAKQKAYHLLQGEDVLAEIEVQRNAFINDLNQAAEEGDNWTADRVMNEATELYEKAKIEEKPLPQLQALLEIIGKHREVAAFERSKYGGDTAELVASLQKGRERSRSRDREWERNVDEAVRAGAKERLIDLFDERLGEKLTEMEAKL